MAEGMIPLPVYGIWYDSNNPWINPSSPPFPCKAMNALSTPFSRWLVSDSFRGSHPKALIEAMSNGCIPIVLQADYVSEIIKHNQNGIILKSENDEIVKIINYLNENEKLINNLSKNASTYVTSNYSKNKIMKEEIDLYNLVS